MPTSRSFQAVAPYQPEQIWRARRHFFDEGVEPTGLVSDVVLRAWKRCHALGRRPQEAIDFWQMDRPSLGVLMERHDALLQAARPAMQTLAAAVADAGYAVMLTDAHGAVLLADGARPSQNHAFQRAFRPGVDLSEQAIGSSAMSVAVNECQPVRIFGPEHFLSDTQLFHCCAAPVFDPGGRVIATVDISRDMPGMLESSLWLAQRCAHRIERGLFQSRPALLHVELDLAQGFEPGDGASQAMLAIGEDGQLIAISRSARQLMSLPLDAEGIHFDDVFEDGFQRWMDRVHAQPGQLTLRLRGGIQLRVKVLHGAPRRSTASAGLAHRATRLPPLQAPADARPALTLGDAGLARTFTLAQRAFSADLPVLITGETGCGKEVVAQALHRQGLGAGSPFVAVNCAGIPAELLAGEMFGHVDGAFTGSRRGGAMGKVEAAHGGTLFLDEIGDMPLAVQATLLRVLDTREVVRLGAAQPSKVDIRIVSATHRPVRELVAQGLFREDLFYRLCGYEFHLRPVRERDDVAALLDAVLAELDCPPERLDAPARAWLSAQAWPGNVRQMRQVLRRALALSDPHEALGVASLHHSLGAGSGMGMSTLAVPAATAAPTTPGGTPTPVSAPRLMQQAQDSAIAEALARCGGNMTAAARLLGIGRATLYRRLGRRDGHTDA